MRSRLLRAFFVFEFLLAIEVWLTLWSQVGGQYHLDLMFWPWKLGLTIAAAWLITAITAELIKPGSFSRRGIIYAALLFAVMVTAGVVTYYYHMNEPPDDQNSDTSATMTTRYVE